jgi:hypothetical protein
MPTTSVRSRISVVTVSSVARLPRSVTRLSRPAVISVRERARNLHPIERADGPDLRNVVRGVARDRDGDGTERQCAERDD